MHPLASKSGGESRVKGGRPDKALFRSQLVKTQPCRFFALGRCTYTQCPFAHGLEELRFAPDLHKTSFCKKFKRGVCPFSSKECSFAHGVSDLRTTSAYAANHNASDDELNLDIVSHMPRGSPPWLPQQREPSKQSSWSRQGSGDSRSTIASEFSAPPLSSSQQISAPQKFDIASVPASSKEALPVGPVRRPSQDSGGLGQFLDGRSKKLQDSNADLLQELAAVRAELASFKEAQARGDEEDVNKHPITSHAIPPNYFQGCENASPVPRFDGVQGRQDRHYASPVTDKRFGVDVGKVTPQMEFVIDLLKASACAISQAEVAAMLDPAAAAVNQDED